MKVSVFVPCVTEVFYPWTALNMIKLLERLGIRCDYPQRQTCCGQPAFNSGYRHEALLAAEHFLTVFSDAGSDYIVAPAGSCVSMVKNHYGVLNLSPSLRQEWERLRGRIYEFSDFVLNACTLTLPPTSLRLRAVLHRGCHLLRELGISDEPLTLLRTIDELELLATARDSQCCGFGGTFAVKFPELSVSMARDKLHEAVACGAQAMIVTDSSCQLQLEGVTQRLGLDLRIYHYLDVLAQAAGLLEGKQP